MRLVEHLADVHAIEEQALIQMRSAPEIAGEKHLAEIFERHLEETEEQERRVRERLEAHNATPSAAKDAAGKGGGVGMLFFAASQPDTPGKLVAHAFAYEHLELAAYELLRQSAERVGAEATVAVASEIGQEEQLMAERLEASFDTAVDVSLRDASHEEIAVQLDRYLADAHAIERQALQLLDEAPRLVRDAELQLTFTEHLRETEDHLEWLERRIDARGAKPSRARDAALRFGGLGAGAFFATQPDTAAKLTGFGFAFEHLEIAAYELLARVARRAEDGETEMVAERIVADERTAADKLAGSWGRALSPSQTA